MDSHKVVSFYNNCVDTDQLDDLDDPPMFLNNKSEIDFKKFHEIEVKYRLDILYFLC